VIIEDSRKPGSNSIGFDPGNTKEGRFSMKKTFPAFLAVWLCLGSGISSGTAGAAQKVEKGLEKTGEVSKKVAKKTVRGAKKVGEEIGEGTKEVGEKTKKGGKYVAGQTKKVGKATVKTFKKIGGKDKQEEKP
jgi:hypothetical protein